MALPALSPAIHRISQVTRRQARVEERGQRIPAREEPSHTLPVSIQLADHHVRRMADERTPDSCNIPSQEAHPRLLQFVIALLRFPQRLVDVRHRRLKGRKLHHRIWDLPSPQRCDPLVQPRIPLLLHDLTPAFPQTPRERRQRRLHAHLDGFERTQGEVCQELRGGAGAEVDGCFVGIGEQLFAVEVLEGLVESVLPSALEAVAGERGTGPEEDAFDAFLGSDCPPGAEVRAVDLRVDLPPAFDLQD